MSRSLCQAALVALVFLAAAPSYSNEILGFRIGSTVDARLAARHIKRKLKGVGLGGSTDYQSFSVSPNGPQLGFCKGELVSLTLDKSGSFHELMHAFEKNQRELGQPQIRPYQTFAGGMPLSSLHVEWMKSDGVMKTLSMWSLGDDMIKTTEGFFKSSACSQ